MEMIQHLPPWNTYWIIKSVLIFFKIIGLATFSVHNAVSKKHSKVALVFVPSKLGSHYNWILMLAMIGSCYVALPAILRDDNANKSVLIMGIKILTWALGNLSVNAILVIYCVNQSNFVRIGNHLIDIERELRRLLHPVKHTSSYHVIIGANLLNGFLGLGISSMDAFIIQTNLIDILTGRILHFIVCWFVMQYFSVVYLVNACFVDVNRALLGVSRNWSADYHLESFRECRQTIVSTSSMQFIVQLRNLHERLCEVSNEISQFYSVPILPVITYSFFQLSYMMYYLFALLMFRETMEYWHIIHSIFIIVSLMYPILLLSNKITNIMDEIASTGRTVHHLLNRAIDKNLRAELEHFSLQVLHDGVEFTASGYFTLDNTFVISVVGVVFTCLVILVQFHP